MARSLRFLALAAAVAFVPSLAFAAEPGWYVGAKAGLTRLQDGNVSGSATTGDANFETGYGFLGAVGYGFSDWRAEGELGMRKNDIESFSSGSGAASGNVEAWTLMGNLYRDFDTSSAITPYVGIGLGVARIELNNISQGGTQLANDRDDAFAYQGILGASVAVAPQVDLDLSYRYLAAVDPDFKTVGGSSFDGEYRSHAVMVGLVWHFASPAKAQPAPAPMAAPVPAPAPAPAPVVKAPEPEAVRDFLVFFDWDRTEVGAGAQAILLEAVASAKRLGVTRIALTGHADRSGPEGYNLRLSVRRGEAVKAFLLSRGIEGSIVTVSGLGESSPLVATADGVREPQNRRVEIVLPK